MNFLNKLLRKINSIPAKDFPVFNICEGLAGFAHGGFPIYRRYESIDKRYVVTFKAHMYEPSYEFFVSGCDVSITDNENKTEKILYAVDGKCVDAYKYKEVVTGNLKDAEKYITSLNTRFVKNAI